MDIDRKKLIEKLKVIRDPQERDRIVWLLAGHEKDATGDTGKPVASQKNDPRPPSEQKQNLPSMPAGVRQIFAYLVPGFFLFFGILNLLQALMQILPSGKVEEAIPQLIMGGILLLFGITSLIKVRKKSTWTDQNIETEEPSQ
jgi:hypothetical protein